jgi:hypothetical protein
MFLSSTSLKNHLYITIHCNRKKQTWKRKFTAAYRVTATANATFSGTIDTSIKNGTAQELLPKYQYLVNIPDPTYYSYLN